MADEIPKNHSKSPHGFWSFIWDVLCDGWNTAEAKLGRLLTWTAIVSPIILFSILHRYRGGTSGNESTAEESMNHWIIFIPFFAWAIWFVIHILKAPHKIYMQQHNEYKQIIKEKDLELSKLAGELQQFKAQTAPLEIMLAPVPVPFAAVGSDLRVMVVKNNASDGGLKIHNTNPNRTVNRIEVRLLKIEPPMQSMETWHRLRILGTASARDRALINQTLDSTDCCDLENKEFEIPNNSLAGGQERTIHIFRVTRGEPVIFIEFLCEWPKGMAGKFAPVDFHTLTIEVTADGLKKQTSQFAVSFNPKPEQIADIGHSPQSPSTKSKEPVFTVEKV